jgi:hypothetical protein
MKLRQLLPSPGNMLFTLFVVGILFWIQGAGAFLFRSAASTDNIAYQGRLADADGNPLTGTYNMTFKLYDVAVNGSALWTETWNGGNDVQVNDGFFNVLLGSITPIPQNVIEDNDTLWLGVTVGVDSEMLPRVQIGTIPYTMQALVVPDNSITTSKIEDGAITQAKAPTLLQGFSSGERIERGTGTWSGAWAQNPAAGTWYRTSPVTFSTPFQSPPVVMITFSTNEPAVWAATGDTNTIGFTAISVAVSGSLGTDSDTFSWVAIGIGK